MLAKKTKFCLILLIILFFSCQKPISEENIFSGNILAMVKDRTISVNDFIRRCEYVPRPVYCKGDNYIHKKIALNSLIAEKILSIEFDRLNFKNTEAQIAMVNGHKEQTMRHLMLKHFGYDKVKVDKDSINYLARLRNRVYKIRFISSVLENASNLPMGIRIDQLPKILNIESAIMEKEISKDDNMLNEVEDILFYSNPRMKTLYGPFRTDRNKVLYFEIKGWTTNPKITDMGKKESFLETENEYKKRTATRLYNAYVKRLMKDKRIDFNKEAFNQFSSKIANIYMIEKEKKEIALGNTLWGDDSIEDFKSFNILNDLNDNIILSYDNKQYTVSNILKIIKTHPLVFRNKDISKNMFENELKYALADLFRDIDITKKAYELGFHEQYDAIRIEEKWSDFINAKIIKNAFGFNSMANKTPSKELISKIDTLQNSYSKYIKIDTDKFEKIDLLRTDMNVIYTNQPYSRVEPDFPILTTDHFLDYGKKTSFD